MMAPADVLAVLAALKRHAVPAWVEGGWGVDALLGSQTREHLDLDLVIPAGRLPDALTALGHEGYAVQADEQPTRVALTAPGGRGVDLHLVTFDADGSAIQQIQDGSQFRYAAEGFTGSGRIGGQRVACISARVQVESHLGYLPNPKDFADMRALAERFNIVLPAPYDPGTP
jgi:lincosamide nucleotidyltransferase A/C/D/E